MGSKSQQQVKVTPSGTAALLVVMYIAAFVAAFNENIINVALHDIMAAFSVSATTAQWLVSGYTAEIIQHEIDHCQGIVI